MKETDFEKILANQRQKGNGIFPLKLMELSRIKAQTKLPVLSAIPISIKQDDDDETTEFWTFKIHWNSRELGQKMPPKEIRMRANKEILEGLALVVLAY